MKDKKQKTNLIKNFWEGIKHITKYDKSYVFLKIINLIIAPFYTYAFSFILLKAMRVLESDNPDFSVLLSQLIPIIVVCLICSIITMIIYEVIYYKDEIIDNLLARELSLKTLEMDYEKLEQKQAQDELDKARRALNTNNGFMGIVTKGFRFLENLFHFIIGSGIILTVNIYLVLIIVLLSIFKLLLNTKQSKDDKEIRGMINDYLSGEFEVTAFNDGMSAIQKITSYDEYALALIDLMLPDISGMEIIKIIRKVSKIPIIIITAKDNDIDKSLGLNMGADDYVVKPFSLIELTARIKANIRRARTYQALPNNSIIKIKDIEIDPHSHMVQRKGVTIDLTPIEFQILYILASHPGQAYSKERLYELIWKEPYFGNENVLNTHINRLRLKLKSNAEDSTAYVKTLWGIGYKMEEK